MAFESKRNLRPPPRVPLRKIHGVDYQTQQLQKHVETATKAARELPDAQGRRVKLSPTGAGSVSVSHGLGRKPRGWRKETQSAAITLYEESSTSRTLTLNASAAGDVTIWVY